MWTHQCLSMLTANESCLGRHQRMFDNITGIIKVML